MKRDDAVPENTPPVQETPLILREYERAIELLNPEEEHGTTIGSNSGAINHGLIRDRRDLGDAMENSTGTSGASQAQAAVDASGNSVAALSQQIENMKK